LPYRFRCCRLLRSVRVKIKRAFSASVFPATTPRHLSNRMSMPSKERAMIILILQESLSRRLCETLTCYWEISGVTCAATELNMQYLVSVNHWSLSRVKDLAVVSEKSTLDSNLQGRLYSPAHLLHSFPHKLFRPALFQDTGVHSNIVSRQSFRHLWN
jgi:hypothetical protein